MRPQERIDMKALLYPFVFLFAACSSGKQEQPPQNGPADKLSVTNQHQAKTEAGLPAFALQDVNGNPVDLKNFAGKRVFVNLWATWCPPCRAEIPAIEKLYEAADKRNTAFLLISLDDKFESAKKFAQRKKLTTPIYYPSTHLPELFQVQGIPATFIFNEKGELVQRIEGAANYNTPEYRKYFGAEE